VKSIGDVFQNLSSLPGRTTSEQIGDGRYGTAGAEIMDLLDLAERASIALRRGTPQGSSVVDVQALVASHIERLAAAGVPDLPAAVKTKLITADSTIRARFRQRDDPEAAWAPEWVPYQTVVRQLIKRLYQIANTAPECRARIVPPLWPFPGQIACHSEPMIARLEQPMQNTPWLLLCEVEDALGHALCWAVTMTDAERNPFRPLVEIAALGLAPMGLGPDGFVIYVPRETG
jgi:hypothetical protein